MRTHPVIRAIGVSHTACKDDFRKIFDLTAAVYFYFYATREKDKYKVYKKYSLHTKNNIIIYHANGFHAMLGINSSKKEVLFQAYRLS